MALLRIYSIRDRKAEVCGRPIFCAHIGLLMRDLQLLFRKEPDNQLVQFPHDFEVWELGSFEDSTGRFKLKDAPEVVFGVSALMPKVDMPEGHVATEGSGSAVSAEK